MVKSADDDIENESRFVRSAGSVANSKIGLIKKFIKDEHD